MKQPAFAKGEGRFRDGPWPLLSRKALAGFAPKAPPQPAGPLAWFRSGKVRHSPSPHPGCAKGPAGAREGPCPAARRALPGSAPKAPPQPAGPLAWFRSGKVRHSPSPHPGFAKGAARLPREALAGFVAFAKGPGRCREGALAGFRARPWPVSRRALAGFAKGPWPWPLKGPGRLREGALAGSAPRPRPSPLGHWRAFGLAKSVAARRPNRLRDARSPPPSPDARLRAHAL